MSLVWQTTSRGSREAAAQEARPSSRAPAANRVARSLSWDSPQDSQTNGVLDGEEPIEATNMEDPEMGPESDDPHAGDAYDDELEDPQPRDTYVDEYGEDQEEGPYDDEYDENPRSEEYDPGDAQYEDDDQDFDSDNLQYDECDQDYDTDDSPYYEDNENPEEENSDRDEFEEYAAPSDESDQDGDDIQHDDEDLDPDDPHYDNDDQESETDNTQYNESDQDYDPDDAPYYEDDDEPQTEGSYTNEYDEPDDSTMSLDEDEPEYLWAMQEREADARPNSPPSKDGDSELYRDTKDSCQEAKEPRVQGTGNTKLATQHHRTREQPIDAYKQWPAQHANEARRIPPEPPPLWERDHRNPQIDMINETPPQHREVSSSTMNGITIND
ncbi:hypothetical protein BC826DRAFT_1113894 [Russula brevipes]|nr:hypothetical protein BC826DRAFT_1113894 [Russula brevipes]